jgi:bacterioferritin-associated ferredoxin
MIVCSCNVLSDHDVRTVLTSERTPTTTGQVYGCLGCSARCGRCASTIRRIMDEAIAGAYGADCQRRPPGGRELPRRIDQQWSSSLPRRASREI